MTEEELRQEAEEKAKKRTKGFACQENCEKSYVMGALDFAEPREKQIAELKSIADFQTSSNIDRYFQLKRSKEQLTEAKEVIEELYNIIPASMSDYAKEPMEHARKFLTEEVDE